MLQHLAIIMDGNRRWAKKRFLPVLAGHKAGADNLKEITKLAHKRGIKYITAWGLSTENLEKRPSTEVGGIIKIIENAQSYLSDMSEAQLKFETIGDISRLPKRSREVLEKIKKQTQNNTGIVLTVALIYGGQDEIVRATQKIMAEGRKPEDITQDEFRKYLDTAFLPVPDVIVRTGGDVRHSGFMLYDSAYAEYYFTDKPWPDYNEVELDKTIEFFEDSKRNFGK